MFSWAGTPPSTLTRDAGRLSGNAKAASTALLAATAGSWSIVPSPNTGPTQYNQLFGVTCPSASDCWAVGYYQADTGSHSQTLIEHWDGSSWSIVPSPNSSTSESNFLLGVTCTSATDCWAVGHHDTGDAGVVFALFQTLIEHYDGNSWSVVSSPNANAVGDNELIGVTCSSTTDCWSVGYYSVGNPTFPTGALVYQTLIEHWDGTSWTIVTSPNSSPAENNSLGGVSCTSATNCWAVGGYSSSVSSVALLEHYDGTSWSIVSSPSPGGSNVLNGVACTSATDCWATGAYQSTVVQSLKEHYDGASWTVVDSANTDPSQSNFPFAITCPSATDCRAVGWYYGYPGGNIYTLIDHYDGVSWNVTSSPNPPPNSSGQYIDYLWGVTCSSTTDCWAVGYYFNVNGAPQTIIEHYTVPPVQLNTVVSRKVHGSAGTFDINLPLTGTRGVECRSPGQTDTSGVDYKIVFTFANNITTCGTAGTTGGSVVSGPNANQCTENLNGIPNGQYTTVTLNGVTDAVGNSGNVIGPQMGLLVGDVNASGLVTSGDTNLCKAQALQTVTSANFRNDVNASGAITTGDVNIIKQNALSQLPASP
jgi:hypothetical protein